MKLIDILDEFARDLKEVHGEKSRDIYLKARVKAVDRVFVKAQTDDWMIKAKKPETRNFMVGARWFTEEDL